MTDQRGEINALALRRVAACGRAGKSFLVIIVMNKSKGNQFDDDTQYCKDSAYPYIVRREKDQHAAKHNQTD